MAAAASSTTICFKDGYAEATSPNGEWHITSNWTDELCKKARSIMFKDPGIPYPKPETPDVNKKIRSAQEKMMAPVPIRITRFAILDKTRVKVIGECGLEFDDKDPKKMTIDCMIDSDYRRKGIAKWLINLLFREYLPAVKFPVYTPDQKDLPWNKKTAGTLVDAASVPVSAIVHNNNKPSQALLEAHKFNGGVDWVYAGDTTYTVYELTCEQFQERNKAP